MKYLNHPKMRTKDGVEKLSAFHTCNDCIVVAVDFSTWHVPMTHWIRTEFSWRVWLRWHEIWKAQMKPHIFNWFYSISFQRLLNSFSFASKPIRIQMVSNIWIFFFLMMKLPSVILNIELSAHSGNKISGWILTFKSRYPINFSQIAHFEFGTYTTVRGTEGTNPLPWAKKFVAKTLRWEVYTKIVH